MSDTQGRSDPDAQPPEPSTAHGQAASHQAGAFDATITDARAQTPSTQDAAFRRERERQYRKVMTRRKDALENVIFFLDEAIGLLDRKTVSPQIPADLNDLARDVEDTVLDLENLASDPAAEPQDVERVFDEIDAKILTGLKLAQQDEQFDTVFDLASLAKRAYVAYAQSLDPAHRDEFRRLVPYWKMKLETAKLAKDEHEARRGRERAAAKAHAGTEQAELTGDAALPTKKGKQQGRATLDLSTPDQVEPTSLGKQ